MRSIIVYASYDIYNYNTLKNIYIIRSCTNSNYYKLYNFYSVWALSILPNPSIIMTDVAKNTNDDKCKKIIKTLPFYYKINLFDFL